MRRFWVGLCCAVAVGAVPAGFAAGAWASSGSGVSLTPISKGTSSDPISAGNSGETDVMMAHIVIEPGGSTGWHYHPGDVVGVVHEGTLTRVHSDCSVHTTATGQSFVEHSGKKNTHEVRNLGKEPVELYVTYLAPAEAPFLIKADGPDC